MDRSNKISLLLIVTLIWSIFAPNAVGHPVDGSVTTGGSCGYMTTGYDDSDQALLMSDDDQCHTFSQFAPDLDNTMKYAWVYANCACLWWTVQFCPAFPQAFAIGVWSGNFPSDLAGQVRSYSCHNIPSDGTADPRIDAATTAGELIVNFKTSDAS